ncbi:MAG: hypothetical protein B6D61_09820 [Bacteroidetes bacterium 4484_249]|nr:MAG: hypothetical protein B6D61_09820 [Bacteroidetes bacterium 4484_249]
MQIRAKEDKFDTTAASALIIANLTKKLSLRASAGIGYKRPEKVFYQPLIYNAKFGLRYNFRGPNLIIEGMAFMKQTPKYRKVGGGGSLNYKFGGGSLYSPGGSLSLTGKGSRTETFQSRGPNQAKTDYTVKFEFKLRF